MLDTTKIYEEELQNIQNNEIFISEVQVKNKNGIKCTYDPQKALNAIRKSAERCNTPLLSGEEREFLGLLETKVIYHNSKLITTEWLHNTIILILSEIRPDVGNTYSRYHDTMKKHAEMMQSVADECNSIMFLGDKSNSNADSALVSTKRVKKLDALEKTLYKSFYLLPEELKAIENGEIYIHDMSARLDTINCSAFDVKKVLSGGFYMGDIWYNDPKTLDVVFDVIGDIVLMSASQQYGGFTIPEVDDILEPYAQKTYDKTYEKTYTEHVECNMNSTKQSLIVIGCPFESLNEKQKEQIIKTIENDAKISADKIATAQVESEMRAGFQGWEYKFNTVASSRGDYPFITVSFGLNDSNWGRMASELIMETRMNGQGKKGFKKPVLFPKLVFLYDENKHGKGKNLESVFEKGIQCSSKTMYPDWLSLTGEGYIASMYKKYNLAISPMGCRAFLSPWYKKGGLNPLDEYDIPVFTGRFNIGAISLNLPLILQKSRMNGSDFYETLDYFLNMIRNIHKRTYDYLGEFKASMNPLGFCEGGFYGGNLKLNDKIRPILKSATASFGITALNELQQLYNSKSLVEDGSFSLEVMKYINEKITQFKNEDSILYAVYGTPAESLCGLQVEQFRRKYGIIKNVSDREYGSNSFHCHVTEDITPIQKQDLEYRFWELLNGGKIQYIRYPLGYNIESMRVLIRRAMKMGLYEGVNLSLAYCNDCGHQELEMDVCPVCGSLNLTKIDRMNGYLSYSRVNGDTRLNKAKMAEIADRKSM